MIGRVRERLKRPSWKDGGRKFRGFKSHSFLEYSTVKIRERSREVMCDLAKVEITGSIPVVRSNE